MKTSSDRTDACAEQVKVLFEDAGVKTVEIDNEVYREAGEVPVDIRQSDSMRQVLEAGYRKTLGLLDNLTSTMPSAGQRMYINACNNAYMKVTSGAFSYQEAVKQAVHDVAALGLKIIYYDSGHTDKLDVAVRRAVLTGVGQTCREIGKMNAEENGCDLMEISAHAGARPEHAVWQGQLVDLTGRRVGEIIDGKRVLSLDDIGYGSITGFGGVNCRHDWYPYFEGFSTPLYTEEHLKELNARDIEYNGEKYTEYEITQMQRKGERKVRELKRRCVTYDEAVKNAPDDSIKAAMQKKYQDSAVKLKAAEQKLKDFCTATGQDRDKFREQVLGFGRSEAQRAVWANKKAQISADKDESEYFTQAQNHMITKKKVLNDYSVNRQLVNSKSYHDKFEKIVVNKQTNESLYQQAKRLLEHRDGLETERMIVLDEKTGKLIVDNLETGVDRSLRTGLTKKQYDMVQEHDGKFIILHNHPGSTRPSGKDILTLWQESNASSSIVVGHDGTVYSLSKMDRKIPLDKIYEEEYNKCIEYNFPKEFAAIKATDKLYESGAFEFSKR